MKNKHEKELKNQDQIHSGLKYSEVNPREFEREMTMVYLQLKGEFSPERVSGSTEKLAITQDLLMPSVKEIEKPVFAAPNSITVICEKTKVPVLDTNPSLIHDRTLLQPIRLPKCNTISNGSMAQKTVDSPAVIIPKASVQTSFNTGVIASETQEKHNGIFIPNSQPEIKLNDVTIPHHLTTHDELLSGTFEAASSAVANAIVCESASKSYVMEVSEVCISSSIPETKIASIPEYPVINPNDVDKEKAIGISHTIISVHIPNDIHSLPRLQNTAGVAEGVGLFMPACNSVLNTHIKAFRHNFRTSVPTLNTKYQPHNSIYEITQQQTCIFSPVNTELDVSSVVLTKNIHQYKSAKMEAPSFTPIKQKVQAMIPASRVIIDALNRVKSANSVGVKPRIYMSEVEMHQVVPKDANSSLQYNVLRSKAIVSKRVNTSLPSPIYKVGRKYKDVVGGQIITIHAKNCFETSLEYTFDFSDAVIQDVFDKNFQVKCNRYHTPAYYRVPHATAPSFVLTKDVSLDVSFDALSGKSGVKISIPSVFLGIIDTTNADGFSGTEYVHVAISTPVPFEAPMECFGRIKSADVEKITPLSIERIRMEAESVFEFFEQ